ncbi:MAG: class I SAM-dependent methyltransferase [Intrasporangium sp.]|uniref:class I SAM-dependent methyltransferase n=1 Tax=Intrasporangium sp. TaxID=1925024 RepID=UPI00264A0EA1|nr:class I SAM-dependent methyltransferase [Intrasporangium sp.]MDN5797400.1 class I SAM-dependent methyltransferase [Intrasporangium sp.]
MDRFSEDAPTWDQRPGHTERARSVADVIRAALPLRADMRALEIGGGTGLLARALAGDLGRVVVTDVAPGMVAAAHQALDDARYVGWEARRYDIEHDPLPDASFDLVLGLLTLHHMDDVASVIGRCAQLLRPGGYLALVDLDHDPAGAFHAGVPDFHGHDGFRREDVRAWFKAAGLVEVSLTTAGSVTHETDGGPRDFPMFLATGRRPAAAA